MQGSEDKIQIKYFTDNKCLIDSLHSSSTFEEKRLILNEAIIKDMIAKREISEVKLTDTRGQLADLLTKATASSKTLCDVLQQGFGFVQFYGISTIVHYFMSYFLYIYIKYMISKDILYITFLNKPELLFFTQ